MKRIHDAEPDQNLETPEAKHLRRQTLLAHLRELRKVLMISGASILVGFLVIFFGFSEQLVTFLTNTIQAEGIEVIYTAMTEAFGVQVKVSIIAGCVLAAPIVLWQVWSFVVPALYKKERRLFTTVYLVVITLFIVGVLFAYNYVFMIAVRFFLESGANLATPMMSIAKYVDFLFSFVLPFGVVFELPVAVFLLVKAELVTVETLTSVRKYVILGIFILSAFLTPPDVISQVMLGVPLVLLYEVGILVARIMTSQKRKKELKEKKKTAKLGIPSS